MNAWTYASLSLLIMLLMTWAGALLGEAVRHRRDR